MRIFMAGIDKNTLVAMLDELVVYRATGDWPEESVFKAKARELADFMPGLSSYDLWPYVHRIETNIWEEVARRLVVIASVAYGVDGTEDYILRRLLKGQ